MDGFSFLIDEATYYDAIIIDLPDPKNVDINKLYTREFYELCHRHLRPYGVIVTQAGSPYYSTRAFRCIDKTIKAAGFQTLPIHNQVMSLGEWGWIIGSKHLASSEMKNKLHNASLEGMETRWLNPEAMLLLTSFGKDFFELDSVEINTTYNPVLYHYYGKGNWEIY